MLRRDPYCSSARARTSHAGCQVPWRPACIARAITAGILPNTSARGWTARRGSAEQAEGVGFLDAVGYFDPEPWHGELARPAAPPPVCARLIDHAARLDEGDTYVVGALAKLDRACAVHVHR